MSHFSNTTVQIRDARIKAIIGTLPHEREAPQELVFNISFDYDASLAATTDAIGHAVDYAAVHAAVVKKVAGTRFFLLERLAAFVLDAIMEEPRILTATVSIAKAGVLADAGAVSVMMTAHRAGDRVMTTTRCC